MSPQHFATALTIFCRQKPFRVFRLELASGTTLNVLHPEAVDLREELVVFRDQDGYYSLFDSANVVRFFQPAIEPLLPEALE